MKNILIILLSLFLIACSTKKEIEIVYIEKKREIIQPKKPDQLILNKVEFEKDFYLKDNIYYIILSDKNYKNLILNLELIKKYIKEQNNIIDYYENETKIDNNKLPNTNK